jgi:UDP-N-acetylmuramoyl-tripeptide--D-alanyl-D-alanine ligase
VSTLLAWLLIAATPLFMLWETIRLRRALHVFQLEGYKRDRFLRYQAPSLQRALYLRPAEAKKPLVMTGRATRILVASVAITWAWLYALVLVIAGFAGALPAVIAWIVLVIAIFLFTDRLLVIGDIAMTPIQEAINRRFLDSAAAKLATVSPLVIGITGSYGKTSTKFSVAGLLPPDEVLATPGSYNTPLGVCRTINESLVPAHRYFVVEMGAYREGDIAELCRFTKPQIGVLTAVGPMHLDRFGSMDAIRAAKYELVAALGPEGIAVMNSDDYEVRALADKTERPRVVRYGVDPAGHPDVTARDLATTAEGMSFTIVDKRSGHTAAVTTRLLGSHAVGHVLAGVCVVLAAGRELVDLVGPVAALEPVEHRLQLIEGAGGVTVIDDAYNSNPQGAQAALDVLAAIPAGRRIVVTPGIVELGDLQAEANRTFGERAAEVADVVIIVATLNRAPLVEGASGSSAEVVTVDSLAEATKALEGRVGPGDVVLFENDLPDQYEG